MGSGQCSRSLRGGTKRQVRHCDSPPPAHGGEYCKGEPVETKPCNTKQCGCPSQWIKFKQNCYRYFEIKKTHSLAEQYCLKEQVFTETIVDSFISYYQLHTIFIRLHWSGHIDRILVLHYLFRLTWFLFTLEKKIDL